MQRTFRTAAAAVGTAGLLAVGLLAAPAMSASAAPAGRIAGPRHQLAHLPLSARQMLADRQLHAGTRTATGAITGSAQSGNGQPLDGVCILAYGPSGRRFTATRPDGRFLLTGLKPGVYQLHYFGCGSATAQYLPQWYGGAADRADSRSVTVSSKTLRPLAPSNYRVKFSSGCGRSGYLTQWWNGKKSAATADTVKVAAAATTTGINASLRK